MEISASWQKRQLHTAIYRHGDSLFIINVRSASLVQNKPDLFVHHWFLFLTETGNRQCFFTKSTYLPLLNFSVNQSNIGSGSYTQVTRAVWMKKPRLHFCFTHKCGVTSAGVCHPSSAVGSYGKPPGTLTPLQSKPWSSLAVRCSHSFLRRGCSISQSGNKVTGLCHVEEAKTPKCGKLQKQTPLPGIALLKPARWGPRKIRGSEPNWHINSILWRLYHLPCLY